MANNQGNRKLKDQEGKKGKTMREEDKTGGHGDRKMGENPLVVKKAKV